MLLTTDVRYVSRRAFKNAVALFLRYCRAYLAFNRDEDRVYTVISGVFYIGLGDQFDADKLQAYAPGSVVVLPGNTSHFHWAKSSEYITQVTAIGPLGLDYLDATDDPRNQSRRSRRSRTSPAWESIPIFM